MNRFLVHLVGSLIVLLVFFAINGIQAQETPAVDSTIDYSKLPRTAMFMEKSYKVNQNFENFFNGHDPKIATWMGFVPGLGQIYNKKYWKLPIVYAGFGVIGYIALVNRDEYQKYANAYSCKIAEDPDDPETTCEDPLAQKYTASDLQSNRDYYRRNMELSFVIMGIWYILQILDATVDAHLHNWEVNDDLSVRLTPIVSPRSILPAASNNRIPNGSNSVNGITVRVSF